MNPGDAETARARWLDALLDLDDPDARSVALQSADVPPDWRAAGERLCALSAVDGILDRDPALIAERLVAPRLPDALRAGDRFGRYRLERPLGEGGMADVWLARHCDPHFGRPVAIKCLRAALSTPAWRQRFLSEQQILSRLSHRHITRLYDAGIADSGTPYIVMEYVDGLPIHQHCDRHRLPLQARLELFLRVCEAVAYAHRNLVVHRDLKPNNVLIAEDGEPRLLDFGIAKLLDPTDADATSTHTGIALLTPAYAAPEQFAHGAITTATDVYGLGALLHELLCGSRARHHLDGRLLLPSTQVSNDAALLRALGSAALLRRRLRGDLDAILQRALRCEPELRYASANELAEDLQRSMAGVPVAARDGNWRYRADKFIRRHWLILVVLSTAVAGLLLTTAISLRESARADQAAAQAVSEAARATLVRDFVLELMRDMRPGAAIGSQVHPLDRAFALADERFAGDPDTRVAVLLALGELQSAYGRLPEARRLLEQAASAARSRYGGDASVQWLEAEAALGRVAFRDSRYRDGAQRLAAAIRRYDLADGPVDAARARAAMRLGQLRLRSAEDPQTALALFAEALDITDRLPKADDALRQSVLELYGQAMAESGRLDRARELQSVNLQLARRLYGDRDLAVVSATEALALVEIELGRPQQARELMRGALETAHFLLRGQPNTIAAYAEQTLGLAELRLGRPQAAREAFERALAMVGKLHASPHQQLAAVHGRLGEAAIEIADYPAAITHFEQMAQQREALQGQATYGGAGPRCLAAQARLASGDIGGARETLQQCEALLRRYPDLTEVYLAGVLASLAELQRIDGDIEAAAATADRSLAAETPYPHERLQALLVLARIADRHGQRQPAGFAQRALQASERQTWTSPCETARLRAELAALVEPHDAELAVALRRHPAAVSYLNQHMECGANG